MAAGHDLQNVVEYTRSSLLGSYNNGVENQTKKHEAGNFLFISRLVLLTISDNFKR